MLISLVDTTKDLDSFKEVARAAFSSTPDASLEKWFSFEEMIKIIGESRGIAVKAVSDQGEMIGVAYTQQESPINGSEGLEKWVVGIVAVKPGETSGGVGTALLKELEKQAKARGATKMFTFTNKGDEKVVHFYQKNGYEDAGWIRDYQYGENNSAVFLLKYL